MDQQLTQTLERAISERRFPGCQVGYVRDGRSTVMSLGRLTYEDDSPAVTSSTRYDVASVTKSVPTSSIILKLVETGRLGLHDRVIKYLPEVQNAYRNELTIWHLLTFTATFELSQRMAELAIQTPDKLLETIVTSPLVAPPGRRYAYSNAPSLLLGMIAERVWGQPLDELAGELFFQPLGMRHTTFRPENLPAGDVAPTEINHRGEVRGRVHDEGAWAIRESGGIPGHAGLFSTASDLLRFAEMLLGEGELEGRRYFKPGTVRQMHTNQIPQLPEQTGLGWALKWPPKLGLPGSDQKFGKTGFTGAIILMDPVRKAAMVHVSNRTYPKRDERGLPHELWHELARIVFVA